MTDINKREWLEGLCKLGEIWWLLNFSNSAWRNIKSIIKFKSWELFVCQVDTGLILLQTLSNLYLYNQQTNSHKPSCTRKPQMLWLKNLRVDQWIEPCIRVNTRELDRKLCTRLSTLYTTSSWSVLSYFSLP